MEPQFSVPCRLGKMAPRRYLLLMAFVWWVAGMEFQTCSRYQKGGIGGGIMKEGHGDLAHNVSKLCLCI